ncbi:MAG: hypothetical protein JW732_01195 [Dehalococcoidia bacterium]|nr:hypothetical protein [Dehalococcoidia bacterium]
MGSLFLYSPARFLFPVWGTLACATDMCQPYLGFGNYDSRGSLPLANGFDIILLGEGDVY